MFFLDFLESSSSFFSCSNYQKLKSWWVSSCKAYFSVSIRPPLWTTSTSSWRHHRLKKSSCIIVYIVVLGEIRNLHWPHPRIEIASTYSLILLRVWNAKNHFFVIAWKKSLQHAVKMSRRLLLLHCYLIIIEDFTGYLQTCSMVMVKQRAPKLAKWLPSGG